MTASLGDELVMPAFATAHSHAFQRGMRGMAQRPLQPGDDFWSWRGQMYAASNAITPESIYEVSRRVYRDLRQAGVMTVGEGHDVHHQPVGTPYDDRTVLSDVMIHAARDLGDGLGPIAELRAAGARIVWGIDSHVFCDPFEEMRSLETHARLRVKKRVTFENVRHTLAIALWLEASVGTARSIGFEDAGAELCFDVSAPFFEGVGVAHLVDALVFSGAAGRVPMTVRTTQSQAEA